MNRAVTQVTVVLITVITAAVLAGCGGTKETQKDTRLIWPPPPDTARIEYLRTLRGEVDYESGLSSVASALAGKSSSTNLVNPFDVCTNSEGTVWVTDAAAGTFKIDENNRTVMRMGTESPVQLANPRGIAYANGKIFIGIGDIGAVAVLSADDGKYQYLIGREGLIGNPVDVAFDTVTQHLVVLDNKFHKIWIFNERGDTIRSFGEWGSEDGCIHAPQAVAFDGKGNMYVVDAFNFRIQVFDSLGNYVRKFGRQGNVFATFARPKGIALDTYGNIYVLDALHQNFQIFNNAGEFLMYVGKFSSKNEGFQNPVSMAIDRKNTIFVTDHLNSRVQVFRLLKGD